MSLFSKVNIRAAITTIIPKPKMTGPAYSRFRYVVKVALSFALRALVLKAVVFARSLKNSFSYMKPNADINEPVITRNKPSESALYATQKQCQVHRICDSFTGVFVVACFDCALLALECELRIFGRSVDFDPKVKDGIVDVLEF